jgi:hypothetical protein
MKRDLTMDRVSLKRLDGKVVLQMKWDVI